MFGKRDAAWATDYDEIAQGTRSNEEIKFDVVVREWLEFHRCVWRGHLVSALYNYLYENPHAQARSKYKHLLVDEFQDLNPVEQQILSLLAQNAAICVFGDENQSIYSFRYANPKGILQWGQGKPAAEFVSFTLSDCYRCPKNIVEMANHLITHNTGYTNPDRNLIAQPDRCGEGRSIWGVFETTSEEIDWIAASVKRRLDEGLSGSDVLILAPNVGIANKIARVIFGSGITARCYYDESILTTNIARVAFSMLNLLVNPDDAASLRWLLGNGSRDWHADAYGAATAYAHENGGTVRDCLDRAASGQIELLGATHLVSRFKKLKVELAELQSLGIALLLDQLFPANNDAVAGLRRIAEAAAKPRGAKLSDILAAIHDSLKTPKANAEVDAVRIMSLHKSKGLGARVVYVAGCANDYLPGHKPSGLTDAEWKIRLEERRRLFYVALTRVKGSSKEPQGEIILTHAVKNGRRSTRSPSIFIRELGGAKPIPVADPEA